MVRRWRVGALAAAAVGLALGADAAPGARLYRFSVTGDLSAQAPATDAQICMAGDPMRKMVDALKAPPPGQAEVLRGCTHSQGPRWDGSAHFEMVCDKAKGALMTMRTTIDGSRGQVRHHMEAEAGDRAGRLRRTSTDTVITDLGPCPAGMAVGEVRPQLR